VTKAERIYSQVEDKVAGGTEKAEAFRELAKTYGQPVDSIRGSYYAHKKKLEGGESKPRPRRRETTEEDALADARASLERSIAAIDREVDTAKARADEAKAEYESLRDSAKERKEAISTRLEALK
jgi:predicted  nucleic acid-binding Zn-ribbon protein